MSRFSSRFCIGRNVFTLLLSCWMIASCSMLPKTAPIEDPQWEISGKIGIREGELRASSTLFRWQQFDGSYIIYLLNPLGQTQLTLSGTSRHARMEKADGTTTEADSPETLLQQATGWYFPVSAARYWLQGKTRGTEEDLVTTPEGWLDSFNTGPWHATLGQYKPVDNHQLPHRIRLQQQDLDITLIIKKHAYFNP